MLKVKQVIYKLLFKKQYKKKYSVEAGVQKMVLGNDIKLKNIL